MDNSVLVKRARAGDKEAFASLYISYKDKLYRYAYFKLGSPHDAQDAVSSCVAEAFSGISQIKNEKAFQAWLFRILYRECCRIISQRTAQKNELPLDEHENIPVYSSFFAPELSEALNLLSAEERDIVLLAVVAEYKTREIAQMLNINHSTVRSKLSRALAKMRNFLE